MSSAIVSMIDVGSVEDFPMGKFAPANIPGKDVWVLRTPDGRWYAIKNTCPHQAASICHGATDGTYLPSGVGEYKFGMEYRIIRCPYHGYEYDLDTGLPAFGDVKERVVRYEVRVDNGRVAVSSKGK